MTPEELVQNLATVDTDTRLLHEQEWVFYQRIKTQFEVFISQAKEIVNETSTNTSGT